MSGLGIAGPGSAATQPLIVDDFDDGWSSGGSNSLGNYTGGGGWATASVDGGVLTLDTAADSGGWFVTNVGTDVTAFDTLELVGSVDGEAATGLSVTVDGDGGPLGSIAEGSLPTDGPGTITIPLDALGSPTTPSAVRIEAEYSAAATIDLQTIRFGSPMEGPTVKGVESSEFVNVGETVTLTAAVSPGDAPVQRIEWELPDGSSRTGESIEASFPQPGSLPFEITAIDANGASGTKTVELDVYAHTVTAQVETVFRRIDSTTFEVEGTLTNPEIGNFDAVMAIYLNGADQIVSHTGFTTNDYGKLEVDPDADTVQVTYERTIGPEAETAEIPLIGPQRLENVRPDFDLSAPYAEETAVEQSYRIDGPGQVDTENGWVALGEFRFSSRQVEDRELLLWELDSTPIAPSHSDLLTAYAEITRTYDASPDDSNIGAIGLRPEDVPDRAGGAAVSNGDTPLELWSDPTQPINAIDSTWVHEFVHALSNLSPLPGSETEWLQEARASYYAMLIPLELDQGPTSSAVFSGTTFDTFANKLTEFDSSDTDLTDPSNWMTTTEDGERERTDNDDYNRGAYVLGSIDRAIRATSDGTLLQVFEQLEAMSSKPDHQDLLDAIRSVSGDTVAEFADDWICGDATPEMWDAETHERAFGYSVE